MHVVAERGKVGVFNKYPMLDIEQRIEVYRRRCTSVWAMEPAEGAAIVLCKRDWFIGD